MKTKHLMIVTAMLFLTTNAFSQLNEEKDHVWTLKTQKKTHTIGLYASLSGQYTEVFNDPAFRLGGRVGFVFNHKWVIGLEGQALNYDQKLTELALEGHYRLEAAHAGLYVEYLLPLGEKIKLSGTLHTGQGLVQYRYDKNTSENLEWYEEFLDRDTYAVFQPEIRLYFNISGKWWTAAEASYTTTSPVMLKRAKENLLEGLNYGISVSYGIF